MISLAEIQARLLEGTWRLVRRAPGSLVIAALLLTLVSALTAIFFLHLDSDQDNLVSHDLPFQERYLENLENFGDQEYLYVVIETDASTTERRRAEQFTERLAERLKAHPELIRHTYYRITPDDLGNQALYFMSLNEAKGLAGTVEALGPPAVAWLRDGRLAGLFDLTAELLGGQGDAAATVDPGLFGPTLEQLGDYLRQVEKARLGQDVPGPQFNLAGERNRYFFTDNGRLLIMRLLPAKDFGTMDVIAAPLAAVRQALLETRNEFPAVRAGLTGRPALQADEMSTTNRDMTRASLIAVVLVGLLFVLVLHGLLRPLLVMACLMMAIAWTFGFTAATIGVLNLLSIVFALVLVGIGVDFGVHIVLRYVEERKDGQEVEAAVRTALTRTGPGVILGAVTSVCAFYAVVGSDFRGLAELGLIGGTGILLCLLVMLTVLPALLLMAGRKKLFPESSPRISALPWLENLSDRPAILLTVLALFTLALAPGLTKIRFSYNLLELQAKGLESVDYEQRMIEASGESTWYAVSVAENLKQASELRDKFLALPTVDKIESLLDLIPDRQSEKQKLFAGTAAAIDPLPTVTQESPPPDASSLSASLQRLRGSLEGLEEKLFAAGAGEELAALDGIFTSIDAIRKGLADEPASAARLADLQKKTRQEIAGLLGQLQTWLTAGPVSVEDLPASLRDIYVGRDGRMQVKVIPRDNIWEFDKLEQFVHDLRGIDAEVSGVPVNVLESSRLMRRTFLYAAGVTLILVILLLWITTRSLRKVLLTLLPLAVGMVWLLSLMGWFGMNFNLANFFAIPILIAIGVDGGVHFLARWQGLGGRRLFATSTPMAVALSFTTTAIGFGGLLLAHHRGLASLGAVMVIGSMTGMLSCLLVLPAVLKFGGGGKQSSGLNRED
jgi:hopanoid biosynthesis associated RND transporter like protein HpnN